MKNTNKVAIIENTDIENAPALKRVGATIIDFALFFLLFFLIGLVVRPILNATNDLATLTTTYEHALKKSNLVTLDQELAADYSNIDEVKVTVNSVGELKYAEATYDFYTVYMQENNQNSENAYDHEWYLVHILKIDEANSYYERVITGDLDSYIRSSSNVSTSEVTSEEAVLYDTFLPAGVTLKSSTTALDITAYNRAIYSGAIGVFNAFDFVKQYRDILYFESILCMLVSASIIYLTIPLLFRNGQTIGKLILKLGLSNKHGYKAGWPKIVLRFAVFFLLYLLTTQIQLLVWMMIAFISLTITIFSRKGLALHDFICMTRVVDLKKSIIYDDVHAFNEAHPPVGEVVEQ